MTGVDEVVRSVRARWERAKVDANPGASEAALLAFESRHGVRLPHAFRALYRMADGNMGDENLMRLWPLEEVCRLNSVPELQGMPGGLPSEAHNFFAFADYMIFSHVYAVRLSANGRDGPVWWAIDSAQPIEIAPTFDAFLQAYAEDPDAILFPDEIG